MGATSNWNRMVTDKDFEDKYFEDILKRVTSAFPHLTPSEVTEIDIEIRGVVEEGPYYRVEVAHPVDTDTFTKGVATRIKRYLTGQGREANVSVSDTSDTPPFTSRGIAIGGSGRACDRETTSYEVMGSGTGRDDNLRTTYRISTYMNTERLPGLDIMLR